MSLLDHITLVVSDYARSKAFYEKALAPLGVKVIMEYGTACVSARSREEVDAFYAAALSAGGRDFGKPGLREVYHPHYYGAFVLDPDGHDVEAVIHGPG